MTTTAFEIRLAQPADYEDMGEIFRRSIREIASRDYGPEQIAAWAAHPDDKAIWAERMRNRMNFLGIANGHIVGFVQYEPEDHVDMTYVHPDFQRQGVASVLLGELERTARQRGVSALRVEASITARPFFERHGYEVVAPQIARVREMDYRNYRMRKKII